MENSAILVIVAVALCFFANGASCLQCYHCLVNPLPGHNYSTTPLCVNFDQTGKYVVDCPYSTMCMKKELQLPIQNGVHVVGVIRDCAPQLSESQMFTGHGWRPDRRVLELYNEGCHTPHSDAGLVSSSYCYCRGDLCNSGPTAVHEGYSDVMGVILVFNLIKYINTI